MRIDRLAEAVQEMTGSTIEVAFVDEGYTDDRLLHYRHPAEPLPMLVLLLDKR